MKTHLCTPVYATVSLLIPTELLNSIKITQKHASGQRGPKLTDVVFMSLNVTKQNATGKDLIRQTWRKSQRCKGAPLRRSWITEDTFIF